MKETLNKWFSHRLAYEIHRVDPTRPWVILIHGAGGSARTWGPQVNHFKKDYNLLIPNLRGHGASRGMEIPEGGISFGGAARDVAELMQFLGIEKAHIVGLSLGSIVAMELAHRHPDKVSALTLAGGVLGIPRWMSWALKAIRGAASILGPGILYPLLAYVVLPLPNHRKARKIFIREARKVGIHWFRTWMNTTRNLRGKLKFMNLQRPSMPVYLITGSQDFLFLPGVKKYAENHQIPLYLVPRCGHVVSLEQPRKFNEMLQNILELPLQRENGGEAYGNEQVEKHSNSQN